MSGCVLRPTDCDVFCNFKSISHYCFDCPALLCNKCKISVHRNVKNHQIIAFSNNDLNWSDKKFITSIINDPEIPADTFFEVSRIIEKTKSSRTNDERIPDGPTWTCEKCTYNNQLSSKKCEMCYIIRQSEDGNKDYDLKLERFRCQTFKQFINLDKLFITCPDIPFENIICSYSQERTEEEVCIWYRRYYPQRKALNIINNIVEKNGFSMKSNELDRKYTEVVKRKISAILPNFSNDKIATELKKITEISNFNCINSFNIISLAILEKTINDKDLWTVIKSSGKYSPRLKRVLMVEMDLQTCDPLELLQVFLKNSELGEYLTDSFENNNLNVKMLHLKQAITDQVSIDGAINFLRKSCDLCCNEFPMPEMIGFITCQHEFCKSCVLKWLVETIDTKYPCKWNCPYCSDDDYKNIDKNLHYAQLRGILSENKSAISIFESKLLQEQLMKSPTFHWCANEECTNGFEAIGIEKIMCPSCKTSMCVKCNRKWQEAHENKTCQEFELWMLKNDPNLSKLLKDIGIECPGCAMRYALAAGGCLHFDCKACGIKFCGGCDQSFVDKCDKPNCKMTNFHSHHPRNCLYFLRDNSVPELENMLKNSDYPKLEGKPEKQCQSMITNDTLKDIPCNKEVYSTTALCENHYKEYLVQFINRYKIDPADFVDSFALNMMLFQMVIDQLTKAKNENDAQFKERLKKTVKESCLFYIPKGLIVEEQPVN